MQCFNRNSCAQRWRQYSIAVVGFLSGEYLSAGHGDNTYLNTFAGQIVGGGYGKLKGKTFRISNMGDETDATIATLIAALDDSFAEQGM